MNAVSYLFTTVDSPPCVPQSLSTSCVATDIQGTLAHEVGHMLGLDHVARAGSIMNTSAQIGETWRRAIDSETASFVCDVYPQGKPARDCVISPASDELGEAEECGCGATSPAALAGMALLGLLGLGRRARCG